MRLSLTHDVDSNKKEIAERVSIGLVSSRLPLVPGENLDLAPRNRSKTGRRVSSRVSMQATSSTTTRTNRVHLELKIVSQSTNPRHRKAQLAYATTRDLT